MNRFKRSLLAAAIATGICGGVHFVLAGASNTAPAAQQLDEGHWRHPHMHRALEHLHEARHELEQAEDIFRGHREESLAHVDYAIKEVEIGLREQHDEATLPADLPAANKLARFPHMHAALDLLHEARTELDASEKVFGGHRDKAIEETDHAIKQLDEGIHDAER